MTALFPWTKKDSKKDSKKEDKKEKAKKKVTFKEDDPKLDKTPEITSSRKSVVLPPMTPTSTNSSSAHKSFAARKLFPTPPSSPSISFILKKESSSKNSTSVIYSSSAAPTTPQPAPKQNKRIHNRAYSTDLLSSIPNIRGNAQLQGGSRAAPTHPEAHFVGALREAPLSLGPLSESSATSSVSHIIGTATPLMDSPVTPTFDSKKAEKEETGKGPTASSMGSIISRTALPIEHSVTLSSDSKKHKEENTESNPHTPLSLSLTDLPLTPLKSNLATSLLESIPSTAAGVATSVNSSLKKLRKEGKRGKSNPSPADSRKNMSGGSDSPPTSSTSFSFWSSHSSNSTSYEDHHLTSSSSAHYEDMRTYLRAWVFSQKEVGAKDAKKELVEQTPLQRDAEQILAAHKNRGSLKPTIAKCPPEETFSIIAQRLLEAPLPEMGFIDSEDRCVVKVEEHKVAGGESIKMIFTKTEKDGSETKTAFIRNDDQTTNVAVSGECNQAIRETVAAAEKLCAVSSSNVFVFKVDLSKASQEDQKNPTQVEAKYCIALLEANIVPVFLDLEKTASHTAIWETYMNLHAAVIDKKLDDIEDKELKNIDRKYLSTLFALGNASLKIELINAMLITAKMSDRKSISHNKKQYTRKELLDPNNKNIAFEIIQTQAEKEIFRRLKSSEQSHSHSSTPSPLRG